MDVYTENKVPTFIGSKDTTWKKTETEVTIINTYPHTQMVTIINGRNELSRFGGSVLENVSK